MRGFKCRDLALLFTLVHTHDFDVCSRCVDVRIDGPFRQSECDKKKKNHSWVVDSGATIHCVNDFSLLSSVYTDADPVHIKVANGRVLRASAVGTARVSLADATGRLHEVVLHNVVYHPAFHDNLLSVRRLWRDNRMSTRFRGSTNYLKCASTGVKFPFSFSRQYLTHTTLSAAKAIDPKLLHSRFGHCSGRRLGKLETRSRRMPTSTTPLTHASDNCPACLSGASKKKPFRKREPNTFTYFGERLSSDLCGPFTISIDGCIYMLNIVDSATNHLSIYCLRSKKSSEVRDAFESFLKENRDYLPTDKPITWHTDNGGEFMSNDLDVFCQEFSVHRSFSVPYAPPQNAHAERMWGIMLRTMRVMLAESSVHETFWPYAAHHACMLHNVLPSTKLAGEISPYQAKYKVAPDVSKIRVWGCVCWYHLPEHERESKLSPRAVPAIHLGCDPNRRGWVIYVPHLNRITSAYHLDFQERKFLTFTDDGLVNLPRKVNPLQDLHSLYKKPTKKYHDPSPTQLDETDETDETRPTESNLTPEMCDHPNCDLPKHSPDVPHSYEQRETRNFGPNPPRRRGPNYSSPNYAEICVSNSAFATLLVLEDVNHQVLKVALEDTLCDYHTPSNYREAIKSFEVERWKESMTKEITDLIKHNTWSLVKRDKVPKSHKVTKSRWVYKIKLNKDGSIDRFKSRFVVCGYSQVQGIDYTHSFSATMRATSFRLLLAISSGEKLRLEHFDVTNAFTQSEIDSEIYVEPPQGYEKYDENGKSYVLKLNKSLYGTKQASRMWQLKLRSHLVENMGFTNSTHDPCLYSRTWDDGSKILVGVYVDDIVVAHNGKLDWFVDNFTGPKGFRGKHVGPLSWFLGMSVEQGSDYSIIVHQEQYITKLLEKFVPSNKSSLIKHAMPCNPLTFQNLTTAKTEEERAKARTLPYLQLVGSLLYLSTMTRPDVDYHLSILCSCMHDPSPAAYYAGIDLLLYLHHTKHYRLHFPGSVKPPQGVDSSLHTSISNSSGLIAYSDSSWRKPNKLGFDMFGYVVYYYGAPVSFVAKHLKVVALSSAEAEYAAASYACKEIVFVRKLLTDLGYPPVGPVPLCVDNRAAINIAENMGVTSKSKHFVDAIHYFRHLVDHKVVAPTFVKTVDQRADGFTKPLGKTLFRVWAKYLLQFSD